MLAVIALLVSMGLGAHAENASQPPPPSDPEVSQPQKSESNYSQKSGNSNTGNAPFSPVFVKLPPSDNAEAEAKQAAQDRDDKSTNDGRLVLFTGVLSVVGILQLVVFGYQGWLLKRTVDVSLRQAEPVLSPYVYDVTGLHPLPVPSGPFEHEARLLLSFNNYGKSAGIIREFRARLFLVDDMRQLGSIDTSTLERHRCDKWIEGEARGESLKTGALEFKQKLLINSADAALLASEPFPFKRFFLVGQIIYDDVFSQRHRKRFCIKLKFWMLNNEPPMMVFQDHHAFGQYVKGEKAAIPRNEQLKEE